MEALKMSEVANQTGLSELGSIKREELGDFMFAAVTGLSDGDITLIHPHYEGFLADMYGPDTYNDGRVAKQMLATALSNRRNNTPIYQFQTFAATFLTESRDLRTETTPATRVYPEAVVIDSSSIALERPPEMIIDYGACLVSRSLIDDQMEFIGQGRQPFQYVPITNLPFMNQAMLQSYSRHLGSNGASLAIENRLYTGLEDGVANGTAEIIDAQQRNGATTEVADIVLCNTGDHLGAEQLLAGIKNAIVLLKEGGMLVVRLPEEEPLGGLSADQAAEAAVDAGFSAREILQHKEVSHNLGRALVTGNFDPRIIKTVVLKK